MIGERTPQPGEVWRGRSTGNQYTVVTGPDRRSQCHVVSDGLNYILPVSQLVPLRPTLEDVIANSGYSFDTARRISKVLRATYPGVDW